MTIVDERGRVFGRFNLIDTAVVAVLLVLVPLGYVAYRLFRPEPIKIISVEPARVVVGQQPRIRIKGEHFRPYLRVQVGSAQAHIFLIETPEAAEMVLPVLPAGTHDLALFDEVSEVARLKNAVIVDPPPAGPIVKLRLSGAFFGLTQEAAQQMIAGRRFPDDASSTVDIVEAGQPREDVRRVRPVSGSEMVISVPVPGSWQVPATIRVVCPGLENQNCVVNNNTTIISPGVTVPLPGGFSFVVDDVRADAPPVDVLLRVQFTGRAEILDLIGQGDSDAPGLPGAARIAAVRNRQSVAGQLARQTTSNGVLETTSTPERFVSLDADIRVMASQTPSGFMYRASTLKPGALFTFDTPHYVARAAIIAVTPVAGGREQ